jgi:cytochrome P450
MRSWDDCVLAVRGTRDRHLGARQRPRRARRPEQWALFRDRPDLTANAVEELLRFDPSAQVSGRQTTAAFTVAGVTIKRGGNIGLMIGAANRDKRRWRDADELPLDRPDPKRSPSASEPITAWAPRWPA